jgi:hypothetical protein
MAQFHLRVGLDGIELVPPNSSFDNLLCAATTPVIRPRITLAPHLRLFGRHSFEAAGLEVVTRAGMTFLKTSAQAIDLDELERQLRHAAFPSPPKVSPP